MAHCTASAVDDHKRKIAFLIHRLTKDRGKMDVSAYVAMSCIAG